MNHIDISKMLWRHYKFWNRSNKQMVTSSKEPQNEVFFITIFPDLFRFVPIITDLPRLLPFIPINTDVSRFILIIPYFSQLMSIIPESFWFIPDLSRLFPIHPHYSRLIPSLPDYYRTIPIYPDAQLILQCASILHITLTMFNSSHIWWYTSHLDVSIMTKQTNITTPLKVKCTHTQSGGIVTSCIAQEYSIFVCLF